MSKKLLVMALALTMVLGLTSMAMAFDGWDQFKGTRIRFLMNNHPFTDYIKTQLPKFEEMTGIDVVLETFPEDQFRTKRLIELTGGSGSVDGFMIMPGNSGLQYNQAGWLTPLEELANNPKITSPDFSFDDFFAGTLKAGQFDGHQMTVPILSETSLLAYRKDLFEKYGVKVPTTMEELEAAAKKLTKDLDGDGKIDLYGITMRGKRAAATSQWVDFLHSFGGEWLDANGKAAVNSKEAVAATKFYGDLIRKYAPPGGTNVHFQESIAYFTQGKAAMIYDANVFKKNYEDPKGSKVAGKVGYVLIPKGPAGQVPHVSGWHLSIASNSRNKEAAWLFIQWATNYENSLGALLAGVPTARKAAWEDPKFKNNDTTPDWTAESLRGFEIGSPVWNPPVIAIGEVRDAVGLAIVAAINGEDVQAACDKAAKEMDAIIKATQK
ncbi:MAG: extracellular solute-binding protein [Firmicutes bacterium]|nr:extracellular solute-binding protein [Bacillota bacterium]